MLENIPYIVEIEDDASHRNFAIRFDSDHSAIKNLGAFWDFLQHSSCFELAQKKHIHPEQSLTLERFKDSIFLLQQKSLGPLDPNLIFQVNGAVCELSATLSFKKIEIDDQQAMWSHILIDRSQTEYGRHWDFYMQRRWNLNKAVYESLIKQILEAKYGPDVKEILTLNTPQNKKQFLIAIAQYIHNAPYETYSRYLPPYPPLKSCDEVLDSFIKGDGGICSEKVIAFYFIAFIYQIPCEIVLGGEDACDNFPFQSLRDLLDQSEFNFKGTAKIQRYWEHFALLCDLGEGQELFCDVANSNIPLLLLDKKSSYPYLRTDEKQKLSVSITTENIDLYYHRLRDWQSIPLDLYYAMEYYIDFVDIIQTIDNELGLFVTSDFWVGAIAYVTPQERFKTIAEYYLELDGSGVDFEKDLYFTKDLMTTNHEVISNFQTKYPDVFDKIIVANEYFAKRLDNSEPLKTYQLEYVFMRLQK